MIRTVLLASGGATHDHVDRTTRSLERAWRVGRLKAEDGVLGSSAASLPRANAVARLRARARGTSILHVRHASATVFHHPEHVLVNGAVAQTANWCAFPAATGTDMPSAAWVYPGTAGTASS